MARRGATTAVVVVALAVMLGGCSGSKVVSSGVAGSVTAVGPRSKVVRFVHPSGWSIGAPGTMIATDDGGAAYVGPGDFLRVTPLAGSTAPAGVASAEAASPLSVDFALVRGPHTLRVDGKVASEYEYEEGTDAAEGVVTHAVRLYVGYSGGVYRVEYGATGAAWDPEAGSDVVTSFRTGA